MFECEGETCAQIVRFVLGAANDFLQVLLRYTGNSRTHST